MTAMNIVMFILGVTTAFSVVGIVALRDWYRKSRGEKTEAEEETAVRTTRT